MLAENEAAVNAQGDEISRRGQAIYDERLKPLLEPAHNGQSVAIHLETGDYVVERNWSRAIRKLRETHKDGFVYSLYIGPPTPAEYLLGSNLSAGRRLREQSPAWNRTFD